MNHLVKKVGLSIYGLGFAYTFCEGFLDITVRDKFFQMKQKDMLDYTMYSIFGSFITGFSASIWPLSLTLRTLDRN